MRLADIDQILRDKSRLLLHGGQRSKRTDAVIELVEEHVRNGFGVSIVAPSNNFYRRLANNNPSLKIHTVGSYSVAPVAINCFEVPPNVSLSVHKNRLSSTISSIYDFDETTEALFEVAVDLAYEKRGWNLLSQDYTSGQASDYSPEIFPVWSDVALQIQKAGEKCGFDNITSTKAGSFLTARLHRILSDRNLHVFCPGTHSMKNLLDEFTLFELDGILLQEQLLVAFSLLNWRQELEQKPGNKKHVFVIHLENESAQAIQKLHLNALWKLLDERDEYVKCVVVSKNNLLEIDVIGLKNGELEAIKIDCETFENRIDNIDLSSFEPTEILEEPGNQLIDNASLRLRWQELGQPNKPFLSWGEEFSEEAFTPELYVKAANAVHEPAMVRAYAHYVISVFMDLTQLVHCRSHVVDEIQRVVKCKPSELKALTWTILSLLTDNYFREKAAFYSWTFEEQADIRTDWYSLIAPAFIPSNQVRKLDIKFLREFKSKLELLETSESGPLRGCANCAKKCLFGFDVSKGLDPLLVKNTLDKYRREGVAATQQIAWAGRLLTERLTGKTDFDVSYCATLHIIAQQGYSDDSKTVTANMAYEALKAMFENDPKT